MSSVEGLEGKATAKKIQNAVANVVKNATPKKEKMSSKKLK